MGCSEERRLLASETFWSLAGTYVKGLQHSIGDSDEAHDGDGIHVEIVDERERLGRDSLAVLHDRLQEVHEGQITGSNGQGRLI